MRLLLSLFIIALPAMLRGADDWQAALGTMPLPGVRRLTRTNCVPVMLNAFQSNGVVKALIFMPGATDEFYMFHRADASLTNHSPTLLDAVIALTNQTFIRATFKPPFLLLHTDEDPLDPIGTIGDPATAARLRRGRYARHVVYNDRDYDSIFFPLERSTGLFLSPRRFSMDSFHFYRHSLAGWNLSNWEMLEALALAGKTRFTVQHDKIIFEGDERTLAEPKLDGYAPK